MADRRPFDRSAPHEDHDLLLVAAFAAGDLDGDDRVRADALVGACGECAALGADLRAISLAAAELPAARRPRDFFVRPADAERLRPHGLRRLAAAIAGPRAQLARPLAGGLMMLGFAGLLVASLPGLGGPASVAPADQRLESLGSPPPESDTQGGPAAPGASGEPAPTGAAFGEVRGSARQGASLPSGAGGPAASAPAPAPAVEPDALKTGRDTGAAAAAGPSALVIGSVALLAIGAVLFLASLLRPGPRRL